MPYENQAPFKVSQVGHPKIELPNINSNFKKLGANLL